MIKTDYTNLLKGADALFSSISYEISLLSNASALLNTYLNNINWVGFYLFKDNKLILGPFQGLVACNEIAIGRGVCGTTAQKLTTTVVKDVHQFPGHIACDSRSNSEIVIPIFKNNSLYGVLDIDSENFDHFTYDDKTNLEKFVQILQKYL